MCDENLMIYMSLFCNWIPFRWSWFIKMQLSHLHSNLLNVRKQLHHILSMYNVWIIHWYKIFKIKIYNSVYSIFLLKHGSSTQACLIWFPFLQIVAQDSYLNEVQNSGRREVKCPSIQFSTCFSYYTITHSAFFSILSHILTQTA